MKSFFDRDIIYNDGTSYKQRKYQDIIEEQVFISYLSQSLTFKDTDCLCPYDRKIVLNTLKEIKEEEKKLLEQQ